tara:strand:+ start:342 stop:863 length:522 start_codon:yes stop_codon:yes gene_type:complete
MNRFLHFLPLFVFIFLVAILFSFLGKENNQLQSVLIEKNFPSFSLTSLDSQETLINEKSLKKLPALVNVWATWCIACRVEHPFLMKLNNDSVIPIYGINYKDSREKALRLLKAIGDPYEFSIFDSKGKLAIDLGVYGAPETFLIDKKGIIKIRHVGVLTPQVWNEKFSYLLNE